MIYDIFNEFIFAWTCLTRFVFIVMALSAVSCVHAFFYVATSINDLPKRGALRKHNPHIIKLYFTVPFSFDIELRFAEFGESTKFEF